MCAPNRRAYVCMCIYFPLYLCFAKIKRKNEKKKCVFCENKKKGEKRSIYIDFESYLDKIPMLSYSSFFLGAENVKLHRYVQLLALQSSLLPNISTKVHHTAQKLQFGL